MPESRSPSSDSTSHDRRRLVFVVCSLVAVTAGGVLVASVGSGGIAGSPIDSVLPGGSVPADQVDTTGPFAGDSSQAQNLGSLTPGTVTGAGGEIALDNGTFATVDTQVHFVAESSAPTYWRTAAYGTYTGAGWERTSETRPYDPPIFDTGFDQVEYNITLNRSATALPTPWRPVAIGGLDEDSLSVVADGSVRPDSPLESGETFTGVSRAPESTPAVLRAANDSHPSEVDRFTELPADTAPRLEIQTGNIVADADGRYEKAVAVQNWLREDKAYSLEAYRESDSVAETFVFEMNAGYCEYFATAMAAMLRTQDIPTRYVVGYTSGQNVGNGTYQVRGMNAHAWVEVYFEGVGWVQFDPTPGGARLQRQEQALDDIGEEYNATDPGSPGEQFDLDEDDQNGTAGEWSIDLNRTAVPGVPVEVTVAFDEEPVGGVNVEFNGEQVGTTGRDGTVTATVPAADEFEITVLPDEPSDDTGSPENDSRALAVGGASLPGGKLAGGTTAPTRTSDSPPPGQSGQNASDIPVYNETVDVTTEADIEVSGQVVPGNEVGVTALVGEEPLADATVLLGGEERGRTDEAGWTLITLPSSPGETTITVERAPISGERSVDVPALDVDVSVEWPLAVPFAPATVEATYGDEPAVGIPIEVNGEQVGTTGTDGASSFRLPVAGAADIVAAQYGVTAETSVDRLLVRVALVVGSVAALLGGVVLLARRGVWTSLGTGTRLGRFVRAVRERVEGSHGLAARVLVAAASRGDTLLGAVGERVSDTARLVLVALGLAEPAPDTDRRDWPTERDGPVAVDAGGGQVTDAQATVRAAWERFLAQVSAPAATNTPGELAAHAIEHDGLPAEPVWTLRDAFRAVEYGARPAEPDRVRAAVEAIEAAARQGQTGDSTRDERPGGHGQSHTGGDD